MSRINEERLLNNSVHDFSGRSKLQELNLPGGSFHNHSKSLMKSPMDDLALVDKKKEILEKKRYEQLNKNNQVSLMKA